MVGWDWDPEGQPQGFRHMRRERPLWETLLYGESEELPAQLLLSVRKATAHLLENRGVNTCLTSRQDCWETLVEKTKTGHVNPQHLIEWFCVAETVLSF